MTHPVRHVSQSASLRLGQASSVSIMKMNLSYSVEVLGKPTIRKQDVTRIPTLFFWFYLHILQPHHLVEPHRRSSITVYHFFAGDFNPRPIRWGGATEAIHFHSIHNKRRPTHIVNLLFIMKLVILSTRDIDIELIVMNIAMGYKAMHNGATI